MSQARKTAVVTGGSSGIGRAAATALKNAGCTVYELSRRDIPLEGVTHITADITKEADVEKAVAFVLEEEGKIESVRRI